MSTNVDASASPDDSRSKALSLSQVFLIVLTAYGIFIATLLLLGRNYRLLVEGFGDNGAYIRAATAIHHWQFSGIAVKQFWGLPYAVAGLSVATRLSEWNCLIIISIAASLLSVALCYWLWDGWIAIYFVLLSFEWFQRSLLGGAEPLCMAFLLGSFFALRRDRYVVAATLGSLATVVRPFGIFALIGLGIQLLGRRRFSHLAIATGTALIIGGLYAWPLLHYFGDPFANVSLYRHNDWQGGMPFSLPFLGIVQDTFPIHAPLTNLALTGFWIFFVFLSFAYAFGSGQFRLYARDYPGEAVFAFIYFLALYMYRAPGWSRSNFPRLALLLLPWVLVFVRKFLPSDQRLVWILTVVTPVLAAASAIGIRNVLVLS
jgi:hypothetical protein